MDAGQYAEKLFFKRLTVENGVLDSIPSRLRQAAFCGAHAETHSESK